MAAVTSSGTAVVTLPSDTQILITREFGAPRHLVYRAYTTPELIKRWWSGDRGEVTLAEVDGRTTLTMLTDAASRADRDAIIGSGMEVGMQEGMDRLEQVAVSLRG